MIRTVFAVSVTLRTLDDSCGLKAESFTINPGTKCYTLFRSFGGFVYYWNETLSRPEEIRKQISGSYLSEMAKYFFVKQVWIRSAESSPERPMVRLAFSLLSFTADTV